MKHIFQSDVERDIYNALRLINASLYPIGFGAYSNIYRVSNEPLNELTNYFRDKQDVLSICASGDQILKCIVNGARNITTFDISNLPKYYLDLKLAAIKNLTRDEFYNMFYSYKFQTNGSNDLYAKLCHDLNEQSRFFWDSLLSKHKYTWSSIYQSYLFTIEFSLKKEEVMLSEYSFLKEDEYSILKRNLEEVEIESVTSDISCIADKVKSKSFDLAYLSNVIDYISVSNFIAYIRNLHINPKGILVSMFAMAHPADKSDYYKLKADGFTEEGTSKRAKILVKEYTYHNNTDICKII